MSRPSGRRLAPGWLGAVAAALLVVLAWGWSAGRQAVREQRRADLRRESAALRRELASLRAEATRPQPALYVGGNEQVDVVLDVGALPVAAAIPLHQERRELHQEPTN